MTVKLLTEHHLEFTSQNATLLEIRCHVSYSVKPDQTAQVSDSGI